MLLPLVYRGRGLTVQIEQYPPPDALPRRLMRMGIDTVLDVGANEGQFIRMLRSGGYRGRIVSFEPLPDAFRSIRERFASDKLIEVHPYALGKAAGKAVLHFDPKITSLSSLLPIGQNIREEWGPLGSSSVTVETRRLDDLWTELVGGSERTFLKIDAQGSDLAILEGCRSNLSRVQGVQTELSFQPLYEGQSRLLETIDLLRGHGLYLRSMEPVMVSTSHHELMEVDGLFLRS